jgi:oligopeptide transport system substrate-binding protein
MKRRVGANLFARISGVTTNLVGRGSLPTVASREGRVLAEAQRVHGSARDFALPDGILLLALCFATVFAGCAKQVTSDRSAHVLRVSQRNEPADLDPATASLPDEFFIIRTLSEGLLVPNPAGGPPLPGAATNYDISPDGLTYTFHLRSNAKWSNGEPVTAADFVASYRRVLAPATAAPKAHLFFAVKNAREFATGAITNFSAVGIRADGPATLIVILTRPMRNFPLYAASGPWIPVNPRVTGKFGRNWTEPSHYVGNGSFNLAEWRPQQRIVVTKNPRYHDAARVQLDQIQFIRFDNGVTEERAFRAGQVDVTMAVPQSKLEWYAHEHPEELHRAPLAETRFIAFNTTRPPLTDPRVRRALALAIDRQTLITRVLRGGQEPADRFLSPALLEGTLGREAGRGSLPAEAVREGRVLTAPPGRLGAMSSSKGPRLTKDGSPYPNLTFDPTEARRLLAAAGFPNGKGFPSLEFSGWDRGNAVLEAVQEMWRRELGVEIQLAVREAKVHLAALNSGNYDVAFVTNLLDVRDPIAALTDFTASAPNNFPHWQSAEFDHLIASAAAAENEHVATENIRSAEELLLQAAAIAPVYFNTQNWLMSPRVHEWQQDALWTRRYDDTWVD